MIVKGLHFRYSLAVRLIVCTKVCHTADTQTARSSTLLCLCARQVSKKSPLFLIKYMCNFLKLGDEVKLNEQYDEKEFFTTLLRLTSLAY